MGPVLDKGTALQSIATYSTVAVAAGVAGRYGPPLLRLLRVPGLGYLVLLLGGTAVLSALAALVAAASQAALKPSQRTLLGLPPTPPPKPLDPTRPAAAPLAPRPAAALSTPLTPQRPSPAVSRQQAAYGATPQSMGAASVGTSARATASPGSRRSPWSAGKAVATPEQLQQYFDLFAGPTPPRAPAAAPPAAAAYQAGGGGYDQGDGAHGPLLPLGRDAPLYRPSIIRKVVGGGAGGAGGSGGAAGDVLQPSADSEASTVIRDMLRIEVADLIIWTERFREWFSLQLLKPLVAALDGAHADANALLAPLSADRLPPLDEAVAGGGGGGGDVDVVVAHLMALAEGGARGAAPAVQQQLLDVYKALHRYQQLVLLLRGRRPADLLPPAPAGYVAAAARRLARGTCLNDFRWNGGGDHQGRPWSADLPTDSVLVFYLFAAFMDAPGWQFPLQPAPEGGRGAPLYLGQLRARPPASYSALLAFRPDKPGPGAAAVIGSNLSSREPRYSWLAEGQIVTLEQRDGVFHSLLLFLSYHDARRQGLLGGRFLAELSGLEAVLRAGAPPPSVPQRVWEWWFPRQ
ncbi:MAG: cytochrome B561, N terminal-domain-containing protein [Monoraphidium minutum]|nr:MAG: cytochrome B561, N terminal-domain-containing protein [Monoraphidium minutum]